MPAKEFERNARITMRVQELEERLMPAFEQNLKLCDPAKNPSYHKQLADEYIALVVEYRGYMRR